MKFTFDWLLEHLDSDSDIDDIARGLTNFGLEVEHIERQDLQYDGFVIARILESERHPNAERLSVCQVDIGGGPPVSVVCGAKNALKGLLTVYAAPGCTIPGTQARLKKSRIRGIESHGMLLSGYELGLNNDHDGIMDIDPETATAGSVYGAWAGLNAVVFDVAPTPNRPDWLGVRGIARDLAVAGHGRLKPMSIDLGSESDLPESSISWSIAQDGNACTRVAGRMVTGISRCESPEWIRRRLRAIGQKPISALVDISNYILFDTARPLHIYDADRLSGNKLTMRAVSEPVKATTLDGVERILPKGTSVIEDGAGIHGIAGIMGGQDSACTDETKNVFIEAAHFEPRAIFQTGRALQLNSEAGFRFERGVDPESVEWGVDKAAAMVMSICGGNASQRCVTGSAAPEPRTIFLTQEKLSTYAGKDVPLETAKPILSALGCKVTIDQSEKNKRLVASPPSWRSDIEYDVCLIEEVFRIQGLDVIEEKALPEVPLSPRASPRYRRVGLLRRYLAAQGYMESVNLTFASGVDDRAEGTTRTAVVQISNPLSSDQDRLRQSLIPALARQARANLDQGDNAVALFEAGPSFYLDGDRPMQSNVVTGLRYGVRRPAHWREHEQNLDAYDAKSDVIGALESLGVKTVSLRECALAPEMFGMRSWFHPGRSRALYLGKREVARFGVLSPVWAEHWDLVRPCTAFEILLDAIVFSARRHSPRAPYCPDRFPAVERDLSFFVPTGSEVGPMLTSIRKKAGTCLRRIDVIDLYKDASSDQGSKSVTIRLVLQDKEKTLEETEIRAIIDSVVAIANSAHSAVLRGH